MNNNIAFLTHSHIENIAFVGFLHIKLCLLCGYVLKKIVYKIAAIVFETMPTP
jgi:hypothetical protein